MQEVTCSRHAGVSMAKKHMDHGVRTGSGVQCAGGTRTHAKDTSIDASIGTHSKWQTCRHACKKLHTRHKQTRITHPKLTNTKNICT